MNKKITLSRIKIPVMRNIYCVTKPFNAEALITGINITAASKPEKRKKYSQVFSTENYIVFEPHRNEQTTRKLLELEAKALRSQMNPHFIFNCMNSIKALIQQKEEDKAISYLSTLSKLIRSIFHNADKREITLYDEIETCRLYTQLESMRFGNKFSFRFNIDETIDLKSVTVPALIVQPFIENAIWHGITPKDCCGVLLVTIQKRNDTIICTVDDNGIGRELSKQNKFKNNLSMHQSRGLHLAQSRLMLDSLLNKRKASVQIIDKKDTNGKAAGTKVILTFKEY